MSSFKEIKGVHEMDDEADTAMFSIAYDDAMENIMLSFKANSGVTPEEYFAALTDFVNMVNENPDGIFVEESEVH